MLGPTPKRVKRKLEEVEREDGAYQDPRQSILNISMCKLKTCPVRRVEPSLRRSVLIFNTLKVIEHELQKEGLPIMANGTMISLPAMDTDDLTLDILPDVGHVGPSVHPENRSLPCGTLTLRADDVKVHEKEPSPLSDPPTYTSLASPSTYHPMQAVELCDTSTRQTVTDFFTSANSLMPIPNFASFSFKTDDQRSDMDISFGDFDVLSAFPQSTCSKLPPLSVEEIVHSFASHTPGLPDSYPPISNPQCCKSDIICEDFDNIMQILVGM